jgi:hypothetical protein
MLKGLESWGEAIGNLATDDVQIVVSPGVGHWVAEKAPDEMLAALTAFLAPYRDGEGRGARDLRPPCCRPVPAARRAAGRS